MVAKSIIKLIDEAIIPASFLIVAKMVGVFATGIILKLPFTIVKGKILFVLPSIQFQNIADYIIVENYSNLAMFLVAALGVISVLLRAHFFHESHIHPNLAARLEKLNLQALVSSSYHLYHQAAIWILFLWLTVGFLIISTLMSITYAPITIIAFIAAANFSWIIAVDIEKEIELGKENS